MKPFYVFVLVVLTVLWAYLAFGATPERGSSFSYSVYGSRAFFLALKQFDIDARTWLHPFSELKKESPGSALLIISPTRYSGATDLFEWVEAGNRLLVLSPESISYQPILAKAEVTFAPSTLFQMLRDNADKAVPIVCPGEASEPCRNVQQVSASKHYFLPDSGQATAIARQGEETSIYRYQLGKGDVWLFAGEDPVINRNIDQYDNLKFLYQLVSGYRTVWFDEFHHGYRLPVGDAQKNSFQGVWVLAVLLVVLLTLFTLSRAIRFGPLTKVPEQAPPGSSEFVMALGVLFKDHHAQGTLRHYLQGWKERAAPKMGISPNLDIGPFFEIVAKRLDVEGRERLAESLGVLQSNNRLITMQQEEKAVRFLEQILSTNGELWTKRS